MKYRGVMCAEVLYSHGRNSTWGQVELDWIGPADRVVEYEFETVRVPNARIQRVRENVVEMDRLKTVKLNKTSYSKAGDTEIIVREQRSITGTVTREVSRLNEHKMEDATV